MSYYENPSGLYGKSSGSGSHDLRLPKLRSDLVVRERIEKHEVFFMIKDPVAKKYYRFYPSEWELFTLFDGNRTDEEIIDEYNEKHPLEYIDESFLETYKKNLSDLELFEIPPVQKNLMLLQRIREQRKAIAEEENPFYIPIGAWKPDEQLTRWIKPIRFFWTKQFFIFSAICILFGLTITFLHWEELKQGIIDNYSFHKKGIWEIFVFICCLSLTTIMHELAHGFTLKNFGGEVHEMGFLLFYISPAAYCDTTDGYMLQNPMQRRWVILSGGYSELFVCSIASFIWVLSTPETFTHEIAFQVMVWTGISSFLLNMNPLVKLDGYYLLMDFLAIVDLREEAFEYVGRWMKRNIFRLDAPDPEEYTRRKRRIFVTYAIFASLYTLTLYFLIIFWFRNIFLRFFGSTGYVFLAATVYYLFRKELKQGYHHLKFLYLDKRELLMKNKKTLAIIGAVMAFLLFVPPTHVKVAGPFTVEPLQKAELRFESDGFIKQIFVKEGSVVRAGQVIAKGENRELIKTLNQLQSQLELTERQMTLLQSDGNVSDYQIRVRNKDQIQQQLVEVRRKLDKLTVRAPFDGQIATPHIEERMGSYAERGTFLCELVRTDQLKIQIPIPEYELEFIRSGDRALLKLDAFPTSTFEGRVDKVSPAGSEKVVTLEAKFSKFLVTVLLDNSQKKVLPGMRGDAKILGAKHPVGVRIANEVWRWMRFRIW